MGTRTRGTHEGILLLFLIRGLTGFTVLLCLAQGYLEHTLVEFAYGRPVIILQELPDGRSRPAITEQE